LAVAIVNIGLSRLPPQLENGGQALRGIARFIERDNNPHGLFLWSRLPALQYIGHLARPPGALPQASFGEELRTTMREILRTNNPIVLSFVEVLLRDAGLAPVVVDVNMSVAEGSIGILPRRILVGSEDWTRARQVLDDAGLGAWTIDDDVA
jgi:hypothetical protein